MIPARVLLFIAWFIATVSVSASLNNAPFQHRAIAATLVGLPSGVILFLLERWITKTVKKRDEPSVEPKSEEKRQYKIDQLQKFIDEDVENSKKAPRSLSVMAYEQLTQVDSFKQRVERFLIRYFDTTYSGFQNYAT